MSVFFQILAAAFVIFLVWQVAKYLKWRIAVVSFARFDAADYPRATPQEAAKSLKLIWTLMAKTVAGIPREQRKKMLAESHPIDHDAARILFALMTTREALDSGEITEDQSETHCQNQLTMLTLHSKLYPE